MFIKKIDMYDPDESEAEVIVSDGNYELLCYALSCENCIGDTNFELLPFACSNVMTSNERVYKILKLDDSYYGYNLQGKLIDINENYEGTIQIGSIIISNISCIPKDIKVGDYIEFTVQRIDI